MYGTYLIFKEKSLVENSFLLKFFRIVVIIECIHFTFAKRKKKLKTSTFCWKQRHVNQQETIIFTYDNIIVRIRLDFDDFNNRKWRRENSFFIQLLFWNLKNNARTISIFYLIKKIWSSKILDITKIFSFIAFCFLSAFVIIETRSTYYSRLVHNFMRIQQHKICPTEWKKTDMYNRH